MILARYRINSLTLLTRLLAPAVFGLAVAPALAALAAGRGLTPVYLRCEYLGVDHGDDWGDWLALGGKTPLGYIDSAYFAYSTRLMAEMAHAIGKENKAAEYRDLFGRIKSAFNAKYVKPDGSLAVDTQTAYALALWMELLPENLRHPAGAILARKIRERATDKESGIATGFLGTGPLLPVLSAVGEHDLAVRLFQSRKFPSWGFEVEHGATTIARRSICHWQMGVPPPTRISSPKAANLSPEPRACSSSAWKAIAPS